MSVAQLITAFPLQTGLMASLCVWTADKYEKVRQSGEIDFYLFFWSGCLGDGVEGGVCMVVTPTGSSASAGERGMFVKCWLAVDG